MYDLIYLNMMYLNFLLKKPIVNFYITCTAKTVYQKFETNIPRKETARPQFPIPTFVIQWAIYIFLVCLFCCTKIGGPTVGICINSSQKHECCTALPEAEFFIEPPPDTQRRRRRGERGIGVTRGSYLLLTSLSPLPLPPPHHAPAALPGAALSGLAERRPPLSPPLHSTPPWPKISDFQERRLKRRTASF